MSTPLSTRRLKFARELADPNWSLSVPEPAKAVICDLLAEVERLTEHEKDREHVLSVTASLLDRTTTALKGEAPPLTSHDQSDLPEVATRLVAELGVAERASRANAQAHMAAERRARQAEEKLAAIAALLNDPDRAAGKTTTGKGWLVTHLHASDVRAVLNQNKPDKEN